MATEVMELQESLLLEKDRSYLAGKGLQYEESQVAGAIHLIIRKFSIGPAYNPPTTDLLVILPAGYPSATPDMFWTTPWVSLLNGQRPLRADVMEEHNGRKWQRWSRHFKGGWRPGVDCLRTFLAAIRQELARGV